MAKMNILDYIALILVIVGAVNWGLVGVFDFNLVTAIFKGFANWIYTVVGIAGLYSIYSLNK